MGEPLGRLYHQELDDAVAKAYGWMDYTPSMPDEEILSRLLELNKTSAADLFAATEETLAVVKTKGRPKPPVKARPRRAKSEAA